MRPFVVLSCTLSCTCIVVCQLHHRRLTMTKTAMRVMAVSRATGASFRCPRVARRRKREWKSENTYMGSGPYGSGTSSPRLCCNGHLIHTVGLSAPSSCLHRGVAHVLCPLARLCVSSRPDGRREDGGRNMRTGVAPSAMIISSQGTPVAVGVAPPSRARAKKEEAEEEEAPAGAEDINFEGQAPSWREFAQEFPGRCMKVTYLVEDMWLLGSSIRIA